MSLDERLRKILELHGPRITAALREEARASGIQRDKGRLFRSMRHQIRADQNGIWGLSFTMPRYGFILHNGVEGGRRTDARRADGYQHSGIEAKGFMTSALERSLPDLQNDIANAVGSEVDAVVRL